MDHAALLLNSNAEKMYQLALLSFKGSAVQQAAPETQANNQINWGQLHTAMRNRYSTLADEQYAVHCLKHLKQNDRESVETFAEHLADIAEEAYGVHLASPIVQNQLKKLLH